MEYPIRVAFDAHQLGRRQTGNETYVRSLLSEYARLPDLDITAMVESEAMTDDAVQGFRVRSLPRSGLLRLAAMALTTRRGAIDVLHAVYFAPRWAGAPVVLTVHDISYEMHPEFFSRSERLRGRTLIRDAAKQASCVVTVSETSRRDLVERYLLDPDRVVAIHNGVGQQFMNVPARHARPIGDRPLRLLALGTLQPRKNLMRLLEAVASACRQRPISLRIVGPDGYQAAVIRDAVGGKANVEIVGYVSDDQLVTQYISSDMLVYPSIYEGFGLPVVEAMACGVPVITSTGGSLPEVAGDAALVIDPFDVTAMTDAILRLGDDVALRADLATRGRARARQFSWVDSAQRHMEVYRAVA